MIIMPAYNFDLLDIGAGVADRGRHFGKHTRLVDRFDFYLAREFAIDVLLPAAGNPLFRVLAELR
jgi:hypothetical protein